MLIGRWLNQSLFGYVAEAVDHWVEVRQRYSPTTDKDSPDYINRDPTNFFPLATYELGDLKYDDTGEMIPNSWLVSGDASYEDPAFVYCLGELDKADVLDGEDGAEYEF